MGDIELVRAFLNFFIDIDVHTFNTFFLKKEVVLREKVICNQRFNVKIEES